MKKRDKQWYAARDKLIRKYGHAADAMYASMSTGRSEWYPDEKRFLKMPVPEREKTKDWVRIGIFLFIIVMCWWLVHLALG